MMLARLIAGFGMVILTVFAALAVLTLVANYVGPWAAFGVAFLVLIAAVLGAGQGF